MSSYSQFAFLYDELTQDVNYKVRSDYISDFFIDNGIKNGTILDLACGTGELSLHLIDKGYSIIGIDSSEEMLAIASNKLNAFSDNFTLLKSEMQNFKLADNVDACICSLDSINHLSDKNDVFRTFNCVYNCLKENGIFVFDLNTIYKHREILANNTFIYDEDNYYLVWDNELNDDDSVRIMLDMFIFDGKKYDRYSEDFFETVYHTEDIIKMLESIGFRDINVFDELTRNSPKQDSERIYFVCKR